MPSEEHSVDGAAADQIGADPCIFYGCREAPWHGTDAPLSSGTQPAPAKLLEAWSRWAATRLS